MPVPPKSKYLLLNVLFTCLGSCSMKNEVLLDGRTKVPAQSSAYRHRHFIDPEVFTQIDTNCLYWELNTDRDEVLSIYRFYGNGRVNLFIFRAEPSVELNKVLNPNYNGYRGVYYLKNGKIKADLFLPINGMAHRQLGNAACHYSTSGDTLFETRKLSSDHRYIYLKGRIPDDVAGFEAAW